MKFRCLITLFLLSLPVSSLAYPALVERVLDGDTLVISTTSSTLGNMAKLWSFTKSGEHKVRLYGIDCPEKGQFYGQEAKTITATLQGVVVDVQPYGVDKYGRTVAVIQLSDNRILQELLLSEGAAWVYPAFCRIASCRRWAWLEADARRQHKGLWLEDSPVEPWQWRKTHAAGR